MQRLLVGTLLGAMIAAGLAAACGDAANNALLGAHETAPDPSGATAPGADGGVPTKGGAGTDAGDGLNTTGTGAGTGAVTGLPCDVQQLLENRCIGCHLGSSPPPLLTYADLLKPAPSDPTKTMAQKSLERMTSTTAPMPPAPAVAPTAAEITTFTTWVNAGEPKGSVCTTVGDGGAPEGGATTNYNTPTVCTSNKTASGGDGPNMRPGGACITCHTMQGGPNYNVAGTVYPTAHEPNNCDGVNGGLTVVVTDANGVVTNIPVNSVGNFSARNAFAPPFHVKVTDSTGTKVRAMAGSLTAGDCNSCHTVAGANGAPGRIMAP